MSKAPLFGSDTRLGRVSLPLDALIASGAQLAYRCEALQGASGELVLIIDYRQLHTARRRLSCGHVGKALARRAAQPLRARKTRGCGRNEVPSLLPVSLLAMQGS